MNLYRFTHGKCEDAQEIAILAVSFAGAAEQVRYETQEFKQEYEFSEVSWNRIDWTGDPRTEGKLIIKPDDYTGELDRDVVWKFKVYPLKEGIVFMEGI